MKKIKVFIDENLPSQLASGLTELQRPLNLKEEIEIEIFSIKELFGQGALDEDWIPEVGKEWNCNYSGFQNPNAKTSKRTLQEI